jgi:hypothetical protein
VNRQYDYNNHYSRYELDCIETVLNLVQKQSKIIDLMAEQLAGIAMWDNTKEEPTIFVTKEEILQYFENEVNEDE